jgi:oligoribonuclease NrnB/cAMP/cGMP phosphodiesterase (DHH superfamily)
MDKFKKETFKRKLIDLVIFHYPCQDGLSSAWVAHHFLKSKNKEHELFPVQNNPAYSEDFLKNLYEKVKDKYVAIFDFSFNLEITKKIKKLSKDLVILDHHATNRDILKDLKYAYFDMELSGVGLAWNYFYNENIPIFLEMIQDRDLWTWKLPLSKDFCDGLYNILASVDGIENCFEYYENLLENEEDEIKKYCDLGKILRAKKEKMINGIVRSNKKVYNYTFNDSNYKVKMFNCDHEIASDLGNSLCKSDDCDFAILWRYDHTSEKYWLSMRANNKVDVSEICKKFGGGGHKNASGCTIDKHPVEIFNNN